MQTTRTEATKGPLVCVGITDTSWCVHLVVDPLQQIVHGSKFYMKSKGCLKPKFGRFYFDYLLDNFRSPVPT